MSVRKIRATPSSGPRLRAIPALRPTREPTRSQRPRTSAPLLRRATIPLLPSSSTIGARRHQRTASQIATGIRKVVAVRAIHITTNSAIVRSSGRILFQAIL